MKNMIKRTLAALLCGCCLISFSGCDKIMLIPGQLPSDSTAESSKTENSSSIVKSYPVTVNGVEITEKPEKAVSLTPSLTEIICELGYKSTLVGVCDYCDYPEDTKNIAPVGKNTSPDIDKIVSLKPDIVLTSTALVEKDRLTLESNNITVLTIEAPSDKEGFLRIYNAVALAFEGLTTADVTADKTLNVIEAEMDKAKSTGDHSFIYITAAVSVAGGDTFESSVLSLYGENCAENEKGYNFPTEALIDKNPDFVLVNDEFTIEQIKSHEIYGKLEAVINDRIITVDAAYFERPSGRITQLLSLVTEKINTLFSSDTTTDTTAEVTTTPAETEQTIESEG